MLFAFCIVDIRKHKELIEEYNRATGQYVITIVEKRADGELPSFLAEKNFVAKTAHL